MPKIISVMNLKGGVGKTTLCLNLARALQLAGKTVAIVDIDPQASALTWSRLSGDEDRHFFEVYKPEGRNLKAEFEGLEEEIIIVDTPPRLHNQNKEIMLLSDLVLMPIPPCYLDLWAIESYLALLKEVKKIKPRLKSFFVVNAVHVNHRKIEFELVEELKEDAAVLKTMLRRRNAYMPEDNRTVFESGDHRAKAEMKALTDEILEYL